jgi:phosphatidylglycerophosphatase B/undecaprenyl-diphosphatase
MAGLVSFSKIFGILSDFLLILEIILIFVFILKSKKFSYWLTFFIITFSSAFLLASLLKFLIPFPRPLNLIEGKNFYDSFPSRHTLIASSLAFSSFSLNYKLGMLNIFFAILIGLFRILGLYHWPQDVLAGFLLGIILSLLIKEIYKIKRNEHS